MKLRCFPGFSKLKNKGLLTCEVRNINTPDVASGSIGGYSYSKIEHAPTLHGKNIIDESLCCETSMAESRFLSGVFISSSKKTDHNKYPGNETPDACEVFKTEKQWSPYLESVI